jgi:Na+-transporting NADH:ubiquinone oxidoreductase subunit A
MADDFRGLKPRLHVEVGQTVRRGDLLFEDRGIPGVRHTAPGAGRVIAIHRGARRALQSIVIDLTSRGRENEASEDECTAFASFTGEPPDVLDRNAIQALLIESGQWTAFRTRPFSKVPMPGSVPAAIFVTAIDTNPLAADPDVVLSDQRSDFDRGLQLIARLTDGKTYLCTKTGSDLGHDLMAPVSVEEFSGPHPAGTAGLHIHILEPVSRSRTVWTIGYQDVASVGRLFSTGQLDVRRVYAIGGPPIREPRLVRSRLGAYVADLLADDALPAGSRPISGSVFSGKAALGGVFGYLGRHDTQLSVVREGPEREFLGWLRLGLKKFSVIPVFASWLFRRQPLDLTTTTNGSRRAMVPIGLYERVMPLDILPTFLLRALVVRDIEQAELLGCLELDEEDLALCTFVDPGKIEYGPLLRETLSLIEREG